eukprot:15364353-Ditylum_brightwellii.AAC.1
MEGLKSWAIPEPQLLIKDHKELKDGHFPTRLVIPATNFAATFSKIGYLGMIEEGRENEEKSKDENGLAIGAYKAAFCADVGATYVYERSEQIFNKLCHAGSYRDDGLTIFKHRMSTWQAIHWLLRFQL